MLVNYQALQYFSVLAKYEHYTRAAKELHITQSALSKSIAGLESELGLPLFEKNGRNIQLTKYGRILCDYAERGMHEIDSGVCRLQEMNSPTKGSIRIAIVSYPGTDVIPDMLHGFAREYPDIHVRIYQQDTKSIVDSLLNGTIHLAICGQLPEALNDTQLTRVKLFSHELGLIVPADSPLANKNSVEFSEIENETFIGYNDNLPITHTILDAVEPFGYVPSMRHYISDTQLIAGLVRAHLGIGIVPLMTNFHMDGTKIIPIKHPYIEEKFYLIWNGNRYLPATVGTFQKYALSHDWNAEPLSKQE